MQTKVYYNEIEPFAAAWLRALIKAGHLPQGDVDERDIQDVQPSDIKAYQQCHFFAGIGGWPLALRLADWGDRPVWTGSCPCQPFSEAGLGKGTQDSRHLWPEFKRLIDKCRPPTVFGEQVASTAGIAWADQVATDCEALGYAFGAVVFPAICVGAPHKRARVYFVSHASCTDTTGRVTSIRRDTRKEQMENCAWWTPEGACNFDSYERLADGLPSKLAKSIAGGFGNAIVPQVAQAFIESYMEVCVYASTPS